MFAVIMVVYCFWLFGVFVVSCFLFYVCFVLGGLVGGLITCWLCCVCYFVLFWFVSLL